MSVRWKPLIILSGLFLGVAAAGVLAFFLVFAGADADDILRHAREARDRGRFADAVIQYRNAFQAGAKGAGVYEELAEVYGRWAAESEPTKRPELEGQRLRALVEAAKADPSRVEPRVALLREAMAGDVFAEQVEWAEQVAKLRPEDVDANYVLAESALRASPPNVAEARSHAAALEKAAAKSPRTLWILARIARESKDAPALRVLLDRVGETTGDASAWPDRLARLRLLALDAETNPDPTTLGARAEAIVSLLGGMLDEKGTTAGRVVELASLTRGLSSEWNALEDLAARDAAARLDAALDAAFKRVIEGPVAELTIHQAYADLLISRGERAECLKVIRRAIASDLARQAALADQVMRLHETAIKAALNETSDARRFEEAAPHIQGLMAGPRPEFQGLGHLFQGAVDLERSGLAGTDGPVEAAKGSGETTAALASARAHLRTAATRLTNVPTAQALYGVALMLSGEPALGRQYLQVAQRLGGLEPRYQVWVAWSMLRGGYPEEAEPIVARMVEGVKAGEMPEALAGTLRMMQAEIAQARRSPRDLELARTTFESAAAEGGEASDGVQLRLAELAVAIDGPAKAVDKVLELRASGKGGPAGEHLAVTTLLQLDRDDEARTILTEARAKHPDSAQLATLEAGLMIRDEKPEAADLVLATFLEAHADDLSVGQLRARLLFDQLARPDEARALLQRLAERTENSGPMAQLALLELAAGRTEEAGQVIAKVRGRWPEAAVSDLLDAQLSLAVQDLAGAARHLDAALTKDPKNKVAQFWKAQLESRRGDGAAAAKIYEELARAQPVKELVDGLSLTTASQLALGTLAMQSKDVDAAIDQFQTILESGGGGRIDRSVRWRLIAARDAKGDWKSARAEIADLIDDAEVENDERVQAANYFRQHGETETARAQLDYVLKQEPSHPGAVVLSSYLLTESKKYDEAGEVLRRAIAAGDQPAAVHLMLAGIERERSAGEAGVAAALAAIEAGMVEHPASVELLRARFALIRERDGVDAALTMARALADADASGKLRRSLVDFHQQAGQFAEARAIVAEAMKAEPRNAALGVKLIALLAADSATAAGRGEIGRAEALDREAGTKIAELRAAFPSDPRFVQADCERAIRQGDLKDAEAISRQLDKMAPTSVAGPVLRAQIYRRQGSLDRAAEEYGEAVGRDPSSDELRLILAELQLQLGRVEEALAAAQVVSSKSPNDRRALIVHARALGAGDASGTRTAARRDEALRLLAAAIDREPDFAEAYHRSAELLATTGRRPEAVAILQRGLDANADDSAGLALLIQYLASPGDDGAAPSAADLDEARRLAEQYAGQDEKGYACLAVGVGFHKAGQLGQALPWMERAVERLDAAVVHLNLGDLLLGMAEAESDPSVARPILERALAEYDKTLALEPTSIEAVNNKAWILHDSLERHAEALALVEGLMKRLDPAALPPEFLDTVGSIQEAIGRAKEAEDSYAAGLRKAPDHPILNLHMGRVLAADASRSNRARPYLEKAVAAGDSIGPDEAAEAARLLAGLRD